MEEKNSDLLLTPSAKKNSKFKREYPFPIVTRECKENESDLAWKIAEGYLENNCVLVHDEESMKMLYCMGFFGKGTLSKNAPKICFKKKAAETKEEMQRSTTTSLADDIIDVVDSDDEGSKPKKVKIRNEDEVLISVSSDDDHTDEEMDVTPSVSEEKESLQLSFQEAFFLSYALGSLVVKDKDKPLNLLKLWTKFCEMTPSGDFPIMYTAYHHLRSKGWIVKNGLKFGTDYVLYKDGPPFYHAKFAVIVRALKENLRDIRGNREWSWASLAALNRINITAGKGLLVLSVIKPNSMTDTLISTPLCISQFKLEEVFYTRWVPGENREEDEIQN